MDDLSENQKMHVLIAEIRRCVEDDNLMAAYRKLYELDAALSTRATEPCVCTIEDGLVQEWVSKAREVAKAKGFSLSTRAPEGPQGYPTPECLDPHEVDRIVKHLGQCVACRALVATQHALTRPEATPQETK